MVPVEGPRTKITAHNLSVIGRAILGTGQPGRDDDRGREEDQLVHDTSVTAAPKRLLSGLSSLDRGRGEIVRSANDTKQADFYPFNPQAFWTLALGRIDGLLKIWSSSSLRRRPA